MAKQSSSTIFDWIDKIARVHTAQIQKYIDKKRYDAIINHKAPFKGCDYNVSIRILSPNEFVITAYPSKKQTVYVSMTGEIRKQSEFNSATKYYQINNGATLYDKPDRTVVMLPNGKEYIDGEAVDEGLVVTEPEKETVIPNPPQEETDNITDTKVMNTLDEDDYPDSEDYNQEKETIPNKGKPIVVGQLIEDGLLKLALNCSMYELLFEMRINSLDPSNLTSEQALKLEKMMDDIEKDTYNKVTGNSK